jgi:hypothetical protein
MGQWLMVVLGLLANVEKMKNEDQLFLKVFFTNLKN